LALLNHSDCKDSAISCSTSSSVLFDLPSVADSTLGAVSDTFDDSLCDLSTEVDLSSSSGPVGAMDDAVAALTLLSQSPSPEADAEVAGAELSFAIKVGRAEIRGSVDRIEVDSEGSYYVIDFKTGKNVISLNNAKENLQLACYQLAVHSMVLPENYQVPNQLGQSWSI